MGRRQEAKMLSSEILEGSSKDGNGGLRRGAWSSEEDVLLRKCVEKYGEGRWHQVPSRAGLRRCRKSCRLRWLNYLKPNIKRGEFADDETDLIIRMHMLLGNRWSLIAGRIPGRTANDIKNYWNTHLSKLKPGIRQLPFPHGCVINKKKDDDMKAPLRTVSKCENKGKNKKNDSEATLTRVVKPQPRTIISRIQLPNNVNPSKTSEAKEAPIDVGASEVEEWGEFGGLDMEFLHALLS